MTKVQYYRWTPTDDWSMILRRTQTDKTIEDEALRDGVWGPTKLITDSEYGHADDVERISPPTKEELS